MSTAPWKETCCGWVLEGSRCSISLNKNERRVSVFIDKKHHHDYWWCLSASGTKRKARALFDAIEGDHT